MREVILTESGSYKLYAAVSAVPTDKALTRILLSETLATATDPKQRRNVAEIFVETERLVDLKAILP